MKKRNLILLFLISLFILPICVFAEDTEEDNFDYGKLTFDQVDIDGDGYVGDGDLIKMRLFLAGKDGAECPVEDCDLTGNGEVNMKDVLFLRKWILDGGKGKYNITKYDVTGNGKFELYYDDASGKPESIEEDVVDEDNKTSDDMYLRLYLADYHLVEFENDPYETDEEGSIIVNDVNKKMDVNADGKINMKDVLRVRKGIVKSDLIEDTPEEPTPEEPEAKEDTTDNPDTGVFYKYGIVALLGVLASAGYVVTRKNKKFPKRG